MKRRRKKTNKLGKKTAGRGKKRQVPLNPIFLGWFSRAFLAAKKEEDTVESKQDELKPGALVRVSGPGPLKGLGWSPEMDQFIGKMFRVRGNHNAHQNHYELEGCTDYGTYYWFHRDWLKADPRVEKGEEFVFRGTKHLQPDRMPPMAAELALLEGRRCKAWAGSYANGFVYVTFEGDDPAPEPSPWFVPLESLDPVPPSQPDRHKEVLAQRELAAAEALALREDLRKVTAEKRELEEKYQRQGGVLNRTLTERDEARVRYQDEIGTLRRAAERDKSMVFAESAKNQRLEGQVRHVTEELERTRRERDDGIAEDRAQRVKLLNFLMTELNDERRIPSETSEDTAIRLLRDAKRYGGVKTFGQVSDRGLVDLDGLVYVLGESRYEIEGGIEIVNRAKQPLYMRISRSGDPPRQGGLARLRAWLEDVARVRRDRMIAAFEWGFDRGARARALARRAVQTTFAILPILSCGAFLASMAIGFTALVYQAGVDEGLRQVRSPGATIAPVESRARTKARTGVW